MRFASSAIKDSQVFTQLKAEIHVNLKCLLISGHRCGFIHFILIVLNRVMLFVLNEHNFYILIE